MSESIIELSRSALANNIAFIRKRLKPGVIISSVLKGNAYGHGIYQMAPELQKLGIHHFSVFSSAEARKVFDSVSGEATIMIMGSIADGDLEWMVQNNIECFVFNLSRLNKIIQIAQKLKEKALVHLEIETGMNRTGFNQPLWEELIRLIKENDEFIDLKGICTHFSGAESIANFKRIKDQRKVFKSAIKYFEQQGLKAERIHTSCSAAIMAYPEENWDMVRIGILQYGLWPSNEIFIGYLTKKNLYTDPLKRVITWKSHVMDIKHVEKRQFIGYGMGFLAERNMKVASVPVGYSLGYSRVLSNQGKVLINGHRLDVIGIVNMNMLMLDVTVLDDITIDDTVTLIGGQGENAITIASFSDLSSQLNYELLTRLDKDIPRKIIE